MFLCAVNMSIYGFFCSLFSSIVFKSTENFYDLVTDFYEYGWGKSFHFAPGYEGETFAESIKRQEHRIASLLNINANSHTKLPRVLDIGCGVGGPMRSILRFFQYRVKIVGININQYHIDKASSYNQKCGVPSNCVEFIKTDFSDMKSVPDGSVDAAYDIEATLHSDDLEKTFREIHRTLKPGARFVTTQYCLTKQYDPAFELHRGIIQDIDETNSSYIKDRTVQSTQDCLQRAGFMVLQSHDEFAKGYSDIEFHHMFSSSFYSTSLGLYFTFLLCLIGEHILRIFPKGTTQVQYTLMKAARSFIRAGELQILTPCQLFVCEKPK